MEKLRPAHNNYVTGRDFFWDREREIELFIEKLDEGAHIQLLAPRRMGKTSLLHEVARRLGDRYVCLYLDLQASKSPSDAVVELSVATRPHASIWQKTKRVFSNILERVEVSIDSLDVHDIKIALNAGVSAGNWKAKGENLLCALGECEKPVAIFIDEVTLLVNRILKGADHRITSERLQLADEFMSWFRESSIKHKGTIRIVLTGSIGLEPILRQAGLSGTVTTFTPFELKPWDTDTAEGCLQALANGAGVTFEEGAKERVLEKLGCFIPQHVQMFFEHIYDNCRCKGNMECSRDDVLGVYNDRMLSTRGHAELAQLEERLGWVLGEELFPLALELLTEAAVTGHLSMDSARILLRGYEFKNRRPNDVLREIMDILEYDGYLSRAPTGFAFKSTLIRDWWDGRHRLFFIPASDRKM
ncbi:ATP-binding protein [Candidatus Poribacteria bacterium]|nr:ATP-binding protein [Candidatus Poribacteria bacterium]